MRNKSALPFNLATGFRALDVPSPLAGCRERFAFVPVVRQSTIARVWQWIMGA